MTLSGRCHVVAFDTNVIVRVLVGDDPVQTKKAEKAFIAHVNGGGVFVSLVVLAETSWVLAAAYEWDRATIHGRVRRLVRTRNVVIEELELVERALDEYAAGKAELADYLILGKARSAADRLLTFDRKLAREDDAALV
jgi:predicted nucleic-acid-binding protein